jgi:hypothetical protein
MTPKAQATKTKTKRQMRVYQTQKLSRIKGHLTE